MIVQAAYILIIHRYTMHKEIHKTKYFICKLLDSSSDDELLVTHVVVVLVTITQK